MACPNFFSLEVFGSAIDENLPADQRRITHFSPSNEYSVLKIGRQHQLAFWKAVTVGEAVNYISREHFEIVITPNGSSFDLKVKNLSSNGIHRDATGHSAFVEMKAKDELSLEPEGVVILNCHTKHEVKVKIRVPQQQQQQSSQSRLRRQSSESRRSIPVTPGNQANRPRRASSLTPRAGSRRPGVPGSSERAASPHFKFAGNQIAQNSRASTPDAGNLVRNPTPQRAGSRGGFMSPSHSRAQSPGSQERYMAAGIPSARAQSPSMGSRPDWRRLPY